MRTNNTSIPFWEIKCLEEMSEEEWESLCDGCGQCCLHKLEDEETGIIYYTSVSCRLLDLGTCQCQDYSNRKQKVPDCLSLRREDLKQLHWLPETCAYRLLSEGKSLFEWHPLISGNPESVHKAGISVKSYAISETGVELTDLEEYLIFPTEVGCD